MGKWIERQLMELVEKTKTENPKSSPDMEFLYIDISSIDRDIKKIVEPKLLKGSEAPSRARKSVLVDDVLFATTRPNLQNIAIVDNNISKQIASTGFCVLRGKKDLIETRFLFNFLLTNEVQELIAPLIRGAQYPAISDKDLLSIKIPLPSLPEQQRIVAKLDVLFVDIDEAIRLLEENITHTQALMGSVLDGIFEKVYEKYKSVPLLKYVDFIGGSQPPKSSFSYELKEGYVRLIQIRDYKSDNHLVYIKKDSTKKFCNEEDIMIGRYGPPVFQILRGLKGAYNVALMKAVPNEEFILKDYLYYFLMNGKIQSYIISISQRSAGQSGVNKKALEAYEIAIPPLEEQQTIVNKIKAAIPKTDRVQELTNQNLEDLKALKSSLLDQAFSGEL